MSVFYRIVRTNPPTETYFLSHRARGIPLRQDTLELRRSWEGVSVYDSVERVRRIVARFPRIGAFIAEVRVEAGDPVEFAQTGDDPPHYDLWAEPRELLALVVRVLPASP